MTDGDGSELLQVPVCTTCVDGGSVLVRAAPKCRYDQPVETINLSWYDGPTHDARVIDLGEDKMLHQRFLIEIRLDNELGCWAWPDDPTGVYARFGLEELEAMVELYRKHAPRGGRPIGG